MAVFVSSAATFLVAVMAAALAYRYRQREWLKEKRFAAYSDLIGALNELVGAVLLAYSVETQLGDGIYRHPEGKGAVDRVARAFGTFVHAADVVVMIGSDGTYEAVRDQLSVFVTHRLRSLPPYGRAVLEPKDVREEAALVVGLFASRAAHDLGSSAKGRRGVELARMSIVPR